MANELSVYYPVSSLGSIYFVIAQGPDEAWNGSTFEAKTSAHWASYAIAGTDANGTGTYLANFPAGIAAGTAVSLYAYRMAGGTAAPTDTMIGTELDVTWDGTELGGGGGGPGLGLAGSGTTFAQAMSSTLWGTTDRLIAANSFTPDAETYLRMPRLGQAQRFWDGFEQLVTSYFDGTPVDADDALARMTDYASTLNAQAEVAAEIVALVAANAGSLRTKTDPLGTAPVVYRWFG